MHLDTSGGSPVNLYRRLQSDRNYRRQTHLIAVEGIRNVATAAKNGWLFEHVIRSRLLLKSRAGRSVVQSLKEAGVPVCNVSPKILRGVTQQRRVSGVVAIVRQNVKPLTSVDQRQQPLWLAVTRICSHGNLGTLLRSSAAFGGSGLILIGNDIDPFEPSVLRSAMGSAFRQQFIRTSWSELLSSDVKWTIFGADVAGSESLCQQTFPAGSIIMLGDEKKGLSLRQKQSCDHLIRIPMTPDSDSLNLGVAGSIILHHATQTLRT